jgi:hypothetical protein
LQKKPVLELQATLQAPQFFPLLLGSKHAPWHSISGAGHPMAVQIPALHNSSLPHALSHVPQFCLSALRLTHLPPHSFSPSLH